MIFICVISATSSTFCFRTIHRQLFRLLPILLQLKLQNMTCMSTFISHEDDDNHAYLLFLRYLEKYIWTKFKNHKVIVEIKSKLGIK